MFNHTTLVVGGGSELHTHHHNTKVVEQRAPTDDSVRLLQEMQDQARETLMRETLEFNGIKCVMFCYPDVSGWCVKVVVKFDVNSKEHRVDVSLPPSSTTVERAALVRDAVAKEIAYAIIGPAFEAMPLHSRRVLVEGKPL